MGFGRYLLKVLVGRKLEGHVGRYIDGGVGRWVEMRVAHFKFIGE